MDFKRARKPEQIEARRNEILASAITLYERDGFDGLSLNGIAREAGLAKSAVYRYFENKEEIFIHFLSEDWNDWIGALEAELAPLADSDDIDAVSDAVTKCMVDRPRLVELMSIASRTLESNISVERIVEFKLSLVPVFLRAANAFNAALPSFNAVESYGVFLKVYAMTVGLWSSCATGRVSEALDAPGLEHFKFDFKDALADGVRTLLRGSIVNPK